MNLSCPVDGLYRVRTNNNLKALVFSFPECPRTDNFVLFTFFFRWIKVKVLKLAQGVFSIPFSLVIFIIRNWLFKSCNALATTLTIAIVIMMLTSLVWTCLYVGRSTTMHDLLFCVHTLWLNCITVTFLLVSSSALIMTYCALCMVRTRKANKNIEQRILPSFITINIYLHWLWFSEYVIQIC